MKDRVKNFFIDVRAEFFIGFKKLLGWSLPVSVALIIVTFVNVYFINPEFKSKSVEAEIINDYSVLSSENSSPPGHEAMYNNNGQSYTATWHGIPEFEFTIEGKGQIKEASLFYKYRNGIPDYESDFIQQTVNFSSKPTGFYLSPYSLTSKVNLVNYGNSPIRLYLSIISKNENTKYTYLILLSNSEDLNVYTEEQINTITYYDEEYADVSYNLSDIQAEFRIIKQLI